jgi:hypothetical protein
MKRQAKCCKPRSDSGISGTLVQRIKAQICLQPYHVYTTLKQGGKIDCAFVQKSKMIIGVNGQSKQKQLDAARRLL